MKHRPLGQAYGKPGPTRSATQNATQGALKGLKRAHHELDDVVAWLDRSARLKGVGALRDEVAAVRRQVDLVIDRAHQVGEGS